MVSDDPSFQELITNTNEESLIQVYKDTWTTNSSHNLEVFPIGFTYYQNVNEITYFSVDNTIQVFEDDEFKVVCTNEDGNIFKFGVHDTSSARIFFILYQLDDSSYLRIYNEGNKTVPYKISDQVVDLAVIPTSLTSARAYIGFEKSIHICDSNGVVNIYNMDSKVVSISPGYSFRKEYTYVLFEDDGVYYISTISSDGSIKNVETEITSFIRPQLIRSFQNVIILYKIEKGELLSMVISENVDPYVPHFSVTSTTKENYLSEIAPTMKEIEENCLSDIDELSECSPSENDSLSNVDGMVVPMGICEPCHTHENTYTSGCHHRSNYNESSYTWVYILLAIVVTIMLIAVILFLVKISNKQIPYNENTVPIELRSYE